MNSDLYNRTYVRSFCTLWLKWIELHAMNESDWHELKRDQIGIMFIWDVRKYWYGDVSQYSMLQHCINIQNQFIYFYFSFLGFEWSNFCSKILRMTRSWWLISPSPVDQLDLVINLDVFMSLEFCDSFSTFKLHFFKNTKNRFIDGTAIYRNVSYRPNCKSPDSLQYTSIVGIQRYHFCQTETIPMHISEYMSIPSINADTSATQ